MNINRIYADKEKIRSFLSEDTEDIEIITVKETDSTNSELKRLSPHKKDKTVLYIAESQTKGRGRMGRSFFSPESTGIYMSILLHPDLKAEDCTLLTPMCAVAVCEAIDKILGLSCSIKWVNDIYIGKRKVAGILTEGSFRENRTEYAIVGIGINLTRPEGDFPEEIKNIAGVLAESRTDFKNELIAEVVNRFMFYYKKLPENTFTDSYRSKLLHLGNKITVISPDGNYSATAKDINSKCHLIIITEKGEEKTLCGGEISIRPEDYA